MKQSTNFSKLHTSNLFSVKMQLTMLSLILLSFFPIIGKAQNTDISHSNSTSYTFTVTVLDAFGTTIHSANQPANISNYIQCARSTNAPPSITFTQGACSYNIPINTSSSCGTCGVCPSFTGVTFSSTFTPFGGIGCTLPTQPSDLLSITW